MRLGRSKEEFLEINGPQMATATHVIVLMSDAAATSPFVFHEVLFADWLGKKLVTAMFKNVWHSLRPSLKAVLGNKSTTYIVQFLYFVMQSSGKAMYHLSRNVRKRTFGHVRTVKIQISLTRTEYTCVN